MTPGIIHDPLPIREGSRRHDEKKNKKEGREKIEDSTNPRSGTGKAGDPGDMKKKKTRLQLSKADTIQQLEVRRKKERGIPKRNRRKAHHCPKKRKTKREGIFLLRK